MANFRLQKIYPTGKKTFLLSMACLLMQNIFPYSAFSVDLDSLESMINQRPWYSRSADQSCVPTTSPIAASNSSEANTTYNGRVIWSEGDINTINQHRSVYEQAAQAAGGGMTWQLVAVLHKIESSLSTSNPSNGEGIFQDTHLINAPTPGQRYPAGQVSNEEFLRQAIWGAKFFKEQKSDGINHQSNNKDLTTAEGIKFALMAYNGLGGGNWRRQAQALGFNSETQMYEGSSYVMNYADEQRNPEVNSNWGGYHANGVFRAPAPRNIGSWLMYNALLGMTGGSSFGGSGCDTNTQNGPLASRIVQIAEREYEQNGDRNLEANNDNFKYTDGIQENWCADFVSWVLNEAGSPFTGGASGGWRIAAVSSVRAWFEEHGEWNPVGGGYTPRPGDIVVYNEGRGAYPSHVNIVVAVEGDTVTTIGGNEAATQIKKRVNIGSESITGYGTKQ